MNPRISLSDLVARLESADHAIAYFNKPLPERSTTQTACWGQVLQSYIRGVALAGQLHQR